LSHEDLRIDERAWRDVMRDARRAYTIGPHARAIGVGHPDRAQDGG
jgi:hypothetical protein